MYGSDNNKQQVLMFYHLKNQALCKYCTHVSNYQLHVSLSTANTLYSLLVSHVRRDSSPRNT